MTYTYSTMIYGVLVLPSCLRADWPIALHSENAWNEHEIVERNLMKLCKHPLEPQVELHSVLEVDLHHPEIVCIAVSAWAALRNQRCARWAVSKVPYWKRVLPRRVDHRSALPSRFHAPME